MKHLFAILVVLIPACRFSLACGPFDRLCTPDQYYTFRLCGADMTGNDLRDSRTGRENSQMDNCRSWAKLTSTDIPLEDIQDVVYHWEYDKLEELHAHAMTGKGENNNAFANWLIQKKRHGDNVISASGKAMRKSPGKAMLRMVLSRPGR